MKKVILICLIFVIAQIFSSTVDGYTYLEGETDHSGIEVFFQRVAPDNSLNYTISTNSTGYYTQLIQDGIYDISYSKTGFVEENYSSISIYSDLTLENVNLGKYSSTTIIESGTHTIDTDIHIESGDTLIIEPGARIEFSEGKTMTVDGLLLAEGVEGNMIYITSLTGQQRGRIWFRDAADDNSIMNYCVIENSSTIGLDIESVNMSISNCIFRNNGVGAAGGLRVQNANSITVENSLFENNTGGDGGGIQTFEVENVNLKDLVVRNNERTGDFGSGIFIFNYVVSPNTNIVNCNIYSNYHEGVTIMGGSYNTTTIQNCNIFNNGTRGIEGHCTIVNSNIHGNGYHGVAYGYCYNSNIIDNGFHYSGAGIYDGFAEYCNVFDNHNNYNCDNEYLGVSVTENTNGDPCDPWYNISLDPKFTNAAEGDFTLMIDSPCIDAGANTIDGYTFPDGDIIDNYRLWDGDGNGSVIIDIGPYEYDAVSTGIETELIVSDYMLFQNYPNPFNPVTTINYALPVSGIVELNVYNLKGEQIAVLQKGFKGKGMHSVEFNGVDFTSGLYIYNLKVNGDIVQSRKMILVK